jgi:hypothetical protein
LFRRKDQAFYSRPEISVSRKKHVSKAPDAVVVETGYARQRVVPTVIYYDTRRDLLCMGFNLLVFICSNRILRS